MSRSALVTKTALRALALYGLWYAFGVFQTLQAMAAGLGEDSVWGLARGLARLFPEPSDSSPVFAVVGLWLVVLPLACVQVLRLRPSGWYLAVVLLSGVLLQGAYEARGWLGNRAMFSTAAEKARAEGRPADQVEKLVSAVAYNTAQARRIARQAAVEAILLVFFLTPVVRRALGVKRIENDTTREPRS